MFSWSIENNSSYSVQMPENTNQKNLRIRTRWQVLISPISTLLQGSFSKKLHLEQKFKVRIITYPRRSKDMLDVFWTFYVHSYYALCPRDYWKSEDYITLNSSSLSFQCVNDQLFKTFMGIFLKQKMNFKIVHQV